MDTSVIKSPELDPSMAQPDGSNGGSPVFMGAQGNLKISILPIKIFCILLEILKLSVNASTILSVYFLNTPKMLTNIW